MPDNLTVMEVVGRQEAPVFTWNPVEQMWVQERGGAAKPPPPPHDVHAIQTWFLDTEENEWIQTVLGPMGRQLAAQWRGAYRVPEAAVTKPAKPAGKKRSPLPMVVAGIVLLALVGGAAVAAPNFMNPPATSPGPTNSATGSSTPVASATPAQTVAPTPEPTPEPTQAPTPVPATPRPRPVGPTYTLLDGTVITYTGPTTAARNGTLAASFAVVRGNGRVGSGSFGVFLNDPNTVANRRAATGTLDGNGRIVLQVPTNVLAGTYQLLFSYAGQTEQITQVTIR
jgi:hypothetical protein